MLKLYTNGIDGRLLDWFRHFITGRKQRVQIRGTFSTWSPVLSGTPQGTILGPILFLVYINDIIDHISSVVKLYADDTKIYRAIKDPQTDIPALQSDLNRLNQWASTWQLRFNVEKCESMRITHSKDKHKLHHGPPLLPHSRMSIALKIWASLLPGTCLGQFTLTTP